MFSQSAIVLEVKLGKGTDKAEPVHVDGELPKEVDNSIAATWQAEPENEGGEDHAQYLLHED